MHSKERWTTRLLLLPLGVLVVGTEVLAQAVKTAHDVAERELDRLMDDGEECCCGQDGAEAADGDGGASDGQAG